MTNGQDFKLASQAINKRETWTSWRATLHFPANSSSSNREKNQYKSIVSSSISTFCFELVVPFNGFFLQSLIVASSATRLTLFIPLDSWRSSALSSCFHRLQVRIINSSSVSILVLDVCSHRNLCLFTFFSNFCSFFNSGWNVRSVIWIHFYQKSYSSLLSGSTCGNLVYRSAE